MNSPQGATPRPEKSPWFPANSAEARIVVTGFALLFCEPHNEAFYAARGWHAFKGEVHAEQPGGKIRFEAMAPYVFDFTRKPRDGIIDLCGLPW